MDESSSRPIQPSTSTTSSQSESLSTILSVRPPRPARPPFPPPFLGNTVYIIDGTTCDAANTTGCSHTPAAATLSPDPPSDRTPGESRSARPPTQIYTANIADGEHPGTVSVINDATCNGHDTSGCGQTPASPPAGFGAIGVAVDRITHKIYVANIEDTSMSMIDGAIRRASNASGCDQTPAKPTVGDYPSSSAVDPSVGTRT